MRSEIASPLYATSLMIDHRTLTVRLLSVNGTACAIVLLCALVHPPALAAEVDCRELDRNYTVTRADITSTQRNALLFTSAARDCGALAARLIADGASLAARDRVGAMPLALAARGGHAALVERFLSQGAPIDARDLAGGAALYAAVESDRPTTVAALLNRGANPNLTGRSEVSPLAAAAYKGND